MPTIMCISNSIREIWLFYYKIEYKSNLSEVKTPRHRNREEVPVGNPTAAYLFLGL